MNLKFVTMAAGTADYEKLSSIFKYSTIVLFALAGVCLAFAVFAFVFFKIPNVIGDLTGRNAKKSIEKMRKDNESGGNKSYRPHPVALDRGKLTEPIKEKGSKKLKNKKNSTPLSKTAPVKRPSAHAGPATEVLPDSNATEVLNYDETGTEVLEEGTQVLSAEQIQTALNQKAVSFNIIQNIIYVHTEETI